MKRWSEEEDAILAAVYPHHGANGVHSILPHRKPSAISVRVMNFTDIRKLPKAERSTESATEIAARVRAEFAAKHPAAAEPEPVAVDTGLEEKQKRVLYGPGGQPFEYGTTAGTKPGLEKVPDSVTNLPWVTYPRDPHSARAVAAICEYMARSSDTAKKVGPEAQRFFESQAAYLRAIAQRMEASAA